MIAMNGNELKEVIADLRLSQAEFARLVGVSVGAVSQWLAETRGIPGPVDAYVDLLLRLPASIRESEIAQLKKGTTTMRNGMYLIHFTGSAGDGAATLTFHDGHVYGFDTSGALYDGTFSMSAQGGGVADVDVRVRMPPNVASVVGGVSHPFEWTLPVSAKLNLLQDTGYVVVNTGLGPKLQATFQRMRDLPLAA